MGIYSWKKTAQEPKPTWGKTRWQKEGGGHYYVLLLCTVQYSTDYNDRQTANKTRECAAAVHYPAPPCSPPRSSCFLNSVQLAAMAVRGRTVLLGPVVLAVVLLLSCCQADSPLTLTEGKPEKNVNNSTLTVFYTPSGTALNPAPPGKVFMGRLTIQPCMVSEGGGCAQICQVHASQMQAQVVALEPNSESLISATGRRQQPAIYLSIHGCIHPYIALTVNVAAFTSSPSLYPGAVHAPPHNV